jgi:hypothetical protein
MSGSRFVLKQIHVRGAGASDLKGCASAPASMRAGRLA